SLMVVAPHERKAASGEGGPDHGRPPSSRARRREPPPSAPVSASATPGSTAGTRPRRGRRRGRRGRRRRAARHRGSRGGIGRWWESGPGAQPLRCPPRPAPPRRTRWPCARDYKRTATEVADGLRALFGFLPELGVGRLPAALHQPWILARERGDDLVHRDVGVGTVVAQVLHVTAAAPVVGVKERVRPAVELEGADAPLVA